MNTSLVLFVRRLLLSTSLFVGLSIKVSFIHAAALSLSFTQIEDYAGLAAVAYQSEENVAEASALRDLTLTQYGSIPSLKVVYFLLTSESEKKQYIAVRGTSNIENAFVDVDLQLVENKHARIRLHRGFAQAAEGIYGEIRPQLKPDYQISTTGHSLGGAVALIVALFLDVDRFNVEHVVTFGQPKITNIPGANTFKHLNVTRVVTQGDLVPLVPPFDPVDINNMDIYWHLGTEVILLPDTGYSVLVGLDSMLRATKILGKSINQENLEHHKMTSYLGLIGKKRKHATLVPYKNDFNLFGWFGK